MANYIVSDTDMTSVANAIRTAGGTSSPITFPSGWVTAIGNISGGGSGNWMGNNPTVIYTKNTQTVYFKNTDWTSWEATTTQTLITATETFATQSINTGNYDYMLHTQMYEELYYNTGAVNKSLLNKCCGDQWFAITRYASNYTNLSTGTNNANYATSVLSQMVMDYYNTSGTRTIAYSWGYGMYPSFSAPTFSSSTSTAPTLNLRSPNMYARCHNSYLTVANAEYLNPNTSFYKIKYELYRVDAGSTALFNSQANRMSLYLNGLT